MPLGVRPLAPGVTGPIDLHMRLAHPVVRENSSDDPRQPRILHKRSISTSHTDPRAAHSAGRSFVELDDESAKVTRIASRTNHGLAPQLVAAVELAQAARL